MSKEIDQLWLDATIEKIKEKMEWVSERSKEKIPYTTVDGVHDDKADPEISFSLDNGVNWWCNGFWAGMMWLMYHETGQERYAQIARLTEDKLDQCFVDYYGLHHDVGFMWLPSSVANYKLTGDKDGRRRGLHAANLLAGRFNPVGKFIRAWNDIPGEDTDTRGWVIIDSMFNIPLLYWAAEETKDPRFRHIAMMHADTVMESFIRPDGSVKHIVEFDPVAGGIVRDYGGQGYAQGSSWTRGQAWGLYGFMMSYIHTGKQEYLDTAKKIAHYFIANIPEDGLIPVDFRQPKEPAWEDSTAAAVAACGLIEIARYTGELEQEVYPFGHPDNACPSGRRTSCDNVYLNSAVRMLKALEEKRCNWSHTNDCILEKCTAAYHNKEHEYNIIYGDYYFMEAVFKLKGDDVFLW